MITMGVDPSTKTGIAVAESGRVLKTCRLEVPQRSGLHRAGALAALLLEELASWDPKLVVFEGYGYANSHTLVTLVEIGTVLRYFTMQKGFEYVDIPPTSLKKFVTGKGNAKKDVMMLEVYKRFGYEAPTNDEADAIGLAMFGQAMHGKVILPTAHMAAVSKILGN